MRAHLIMVLLSWLLLAPALGCDIGTDWPEEGSAGAGGSGGALSCDADCVPLPRWHGPSLFAIGPFSDLPACPGDLAPYPGIELYDGLSAPPPDCPTCLCDPSSTECLAPTAWHASAAKCEEAQSADLTDFSASPGWSGACTTQNAIQSGALCNGVPCVQSVTVQAPEPAAGSCPPRAIGGGPPPPVSWSTRARECLPHDPDTCPEEPPACRPPTGFSMCVYKEGNLPCEEPYPTKHLLFRAHDDKRACSPCTCGPPAESACIVFVTAYTDAACGTVAGAIHVASGQGEGCFDMPAGFPLAAKTAEVIAAQKGTCAASGGEPHGTAFPSGPVTVCCREEKVPR